MVAIAAERLRAGKVLERCPLQHTRRNGRLVVPLLRLKGVHARIEDATGRKRVRGCLA